MKLGSPVFAVALATSFGVTFVTAQQPAAPASAPAVSAPQAPGAPPAGDPGRGGPGRGGARGGGGGGGGRIMVLSPKMQKPTGWTGVHKPHTKLVDVLAKHKGQTDWAETVVDDESLFAQWVSMGPGKKTPRRMNGDTVEWWVVQAGTLKFTIEGQEPITATKGFMVQVPYRNVYQIENVGTEPALRFEGNVTRARKLYPMDETPVPMAGYDFVPTSVGGGKGTLPQGQRQVLDFNEVVAGRANGGAFVSDDRAFANIIMGTYQRPAATDKGHFHEEGSEFWLIMLGKVRYKLEGMAEFEAEPGDIVYAPRSMWHLASFGGQEGLRSCRVAMNGWPFQGHMYEPAAAPPAGRGAD
jgi:mannose-6-phosphate isomerase-like protein (cupin superfamily)